MKNQFQPPLIGFNPPMIDSGKNPENFVWELKITRNNGITILEENIPTKDRAVRWMMSALSEDEDIVFASVAQRNA